ncbi:MAG: sugar-binding transcriptional regulator [Spirochaetales bacterium]|nr:MAG: sugar-binding transcriptional regulator [Spirochaetales bacterium]
MVKHGMDITRRDFLITLARHYYEEDLSQQEIADRYSISRSNVSKMLKACKEEKIVEIRIQAPSSQALQFKARLEETFNIDHAIIAPSAGDTEATKTEAARAGAAYLCSLLEDSMKIGISWGTTLYRLVQEVTPPDVKNIEVIQLHGGFGAKNPEIDGHELAGMLARKLKGSYRVMQAPAIVQNHELRDLLLKEPNIAETIALAGSVHIALMGIGSNLPEISSMVRAGYLTEAESAELLEKGAVGVMCGLHFDKKGKLLSSPINDRHIGLPPEALLAIPKRFGVAVGSKKIQPILAALTGGLINILVTDEQTAMGILYHHETDN